MLTQKSVASIESIVCSRIAFVIMCRFNDHFKIFVKLWKGILAEKKDLNAKIAALKKARSNTDVLRKKVYKAEEKEPRDQVSTL